MAWVGLGVWLSLAGVFDDRSNGFKSLNNFCWQLKTFFVRMLKI